MKLYVLKHACGKDQLYPICFNPSDSPWYYLCWTLGAPFRQSVPTPIVYHMAGPPSLADYIRTNAGHFLVSSRFLVVVSSVATAFRAYESHIYAANRLLSKNYWSINMERLYPCFDWRRSDYDMGGPAGQRYVSYVRSLALQQTGIPADEQLFRVQGYSMAIVITEHVRDLIQKANLTGIDCEEVLVTPP